MNLSEAVRLIESAASDVRRLSECDPYVTEAMVDECFFCFQPKSTGTHLMSCLWQSANRKADTP